MSTYHPHVRIQKGFNAVKFEVAKPSLPTRAKTLLKQALLRLALI